MERAGEEVAAKDLAVDTELERKECEVPLTLEGHVLMDSRTSIESVRSNWPVTLSFPHNCTVNGKDLNRCVTSPLDGSASAMNDAESGVVFEELTVENYKTSNLSLASNGLQNRWEHPYPSATGYRLKALHGDPVAQNVQLSRMSSGKKGLNPLLRKEIDQTPEGISSCLNLTENKTNTSSSPLAIAATQLKTLSSISFPHFSVKPSLKGKGVINRNSEACTSGKPDLISSHGVGRFPAESLRNGISLRELLKPGRAKRDKVESLLLFNQIVELVDSAHSQGVALRDLRPSCFNISSSNKVIYTGLCAKKGLGSTANAEFNRKRPLEEEDLHPNFISGAKQLKLNAGMQYLGSTSSRSSRPEIVTKIAFHITRPQELSCAQNQPQNLRQPVASVAREQPSTLAAIQLEKKWYSCPEELSGRDCTFSSNIYCLGVILFELLCCFESREAHSATMSDLRYRILPPSFLSENPKEAGFCLWLLHPEPLSRPTTREILLSDLMCDSRGLCENDLSTSPDGDDTESELLLHFLITLKEQNQKRSSKLVEDIACLEEDIKEVERRHLLRTYSESSQLINELPDARKWQLHLEDHQSSVSHSGSVLNSNMNKGWLIKNISQLEDAYFSMRSQIHHTETAAALRADKVGDRCSEAQIENGELRVNEKHMEPLGAFFEGLCKFARYSKFEVCGRLRSGDLLNSANVICTVSFDRDEDYIAAAGISKQIKIFELGAFMKDSVDIHYPVVEMSNKSKLSCVSWNPYIKNYMASTDYDGIVQIWDAGTARGFCQYAEHQKRAWSVDFSQADPTKFASGSDDCSVKLWSINERSSLGTIWSQANVCCVQFSAFSTHQLAFGSADYKVHCYDLRHARIPLCTLAGHEKAVSYVKFLDSKTLVSASTDNTVKLWDLDKTSSDGLSSNTCSLTFTGHTNEKNFVGLSVMDGYIACGSETNEVYCYYRSLPMPITSYKFGSIDCISGHGLNDINGQFVSSVCWRQKSNMLIAANSSGSIKLLKMV